MKQKPLNPEALSNLYLACNAAWHLCESLLACPGATPELITEVRDALKAAMTSADVTAIPKVERYKMRHEHLHRELDELIACWIAQQPRVYLSTTSIEELVRWSFAMTHNPTCAKEHQ